MAKRTRKSADSSKSQKDETDVPQRPIPSGTGDGDGNGNGNGDAETEQIAEEIATRDASGPEPTVQVDRQAMPVDHENPPKLPFPVVGIGASAGGLEAMTEFVSATRPDSGMAFVFIQHLPPERESHIADILGHKTKMPVRQVDEGMTIEPNCVYVIRPGKVLTMLNGRLHLGERLGKEGSGAGTGRVANRPVDDFFRSLAEEQRERSIAIILSGMGSNGSAGCQAIKAVGGVCIAQDPDTAQFPSMPRHLIDQGYADYILKPGDMPEVLLDYAGHPYTKEAHHDAGKQVERNQQYVREILAILRTRTRTDFGGYKKPTLLRRIQRRMGLSRLADMGDYARLLRQSPSEVISLADDLLIHVTGFFRDQEAWQAMRRHVIEPLVARREPESEIRGWVTACASGEEAYTLAMLLVEEAEKQNKPLGIKVFATDMAERPLHHARAGVYPGGIESEISPERLERFFEKEDGVYRVKQHLRECVVFAPQNVLSDPPFSRLDIVSCRNLLIYLEPDVQHRVLSLLHFGLREGGALFLGSSETVAGADELYELIDKRARIFRRIGPTRHGQLDFPVPRVLRGIGQVGTPGDGGAALTELGKPGDRRVVGRPSIANLTQRTLLERHVRAAVAVDRDHRILYYHGNTRPFLDQPPGEPTRDLLKLARNGLSGSIRVALHRCAAEQQAVTVMDGWLETAPGRQTRIAVTASPIASDDPHGSEYYVVSFEQLDESHSAPGAGGGGGGGEGGGAGGDAAPAEDELRRVRSELQATIEELQTSNEELKASNEEVTSMNEELQSSNEELETSKEEMQSLNEELTTVNAQLQAKMEEHQTASNDLTALLTSTDIAVLFLDPRLSIRRYTPAVRDLLDVIGSDLGRPLADLNRKFDDPQLDEDVRAVLDKLAPVEREINGANGRTYDRRVLPYRTADNRIDGVVVTFVDVTERKRAERALAEERGLAEQIVETLHEPLLVLGTDLTVRSANPSFYEHFKVIPARTVGRKIYDLGNGQWNIPALRKLLEDVLPTNKVFNDYQVIHQFEDLGRRVMLVNARRLDHQQLILLGVRDVTERHGMEQSLRQNEERLRQMMDIEGAGVISFDASTGALIDANDPFLRMTGYTREDVRSGRLTWRTMTPAEYLPLSEQQILQMKKTGRVGPYEKEYFRKDGSRSWMLFTGSLVGDTIVEYCIDISEWKRTKAALQGSEQRFQLIADNVRDYAIFTLDPVGKITSWNSGAQRIFRYTADEIIGHDASDLFTPEDRAAGEHEKELRTAAIDGRASDDRWQMRKGEERFWATGVTTAIREGGGGTEAELLGFIKICRDETARKQAEGAEKAALDAAELANQSKDEFLATLSHELRTPLAAILLWSKMLNSKSPQASLEDGLAAIRNSAEAQKQLIEDLLDTSRITSGKLRLELKVTDLSAVVDGAVEAVLPAAQAKGIHLAKEVDPKIGVVRVDPNRMQQVLWNLLSNAVKFTPAGGRVELNLRRRGHDVEMRVTDTGTGISPDFLPHVFEPFRQADSTTTRSHGGLGLGLAICRKLVEQHGGTIQALSEGPGRGSTFIVTLPSPSLRSTASPKTRRASAATAAADARQPQTPLAGMNVLLVEDEPETRNALATAIRLGGANVTPVDSAAAALAAFQESKVDLLVSDIGMAGEDGYSLIRRVRAIESEKGTQRTPALALTAFVGEEDQRKAQAAGFDRHLDKPVEPDQLISVLIELSAMR